MSPPELLVFDDARATDWQPFTLTRPAGEIRFGMLTLRERQERALGLRCIGHIAAADLADFDELGAPPVLSLDAVPTDRDVFYLSSRVVPAWGVRLPVPSAPTVITVAGRACGLFVPAGHHPPDAAFLAAPEEAAVDAAGTLALTGSMLDRVWHVITRGAEQTARDVAALFPDAARPALPHGVHVLGDQPVILGQNVRLEPGVVLDVRHGPVALGDDVAVEAFTRLAGPSAVGPRTILLGGEMERVSAGPVCKLHGQIEETVVLGYANKAHDGFLGHALVGRWVNLGAMTTNSDLKNNYGSVRVWTPSGEVDTREIKLGCLLGDHVRTGIGTLLNTGTVVGAGSNLFGTAMPPKLVPPFSWGTGERLSVYDLDRFLDTARTAMARRDVALSPRSDRLLRAAWKRSRALAAEVGG